MDRWKEHIDKMDAVSLKSNNLMLELVNYQYGYIAWCIGNNKEDDAKKYLDKAEANLLILSEDNQNVSMVNAYKAAFYGYRIGLNKILAPILGRKSIDCAKIAMVADKENPFAYVQYGNIQFYMPAVFGGSKKEGLAFYKRAEELMEKNKDYTVGNWNYLSLLTVIAQSYSYLGDYDSAIDYLEKILKIEPEFDWVKNELYPQVLSKIKE
jgi:tetratricopeptide (TPR) repeat protein